MHVLVQVSIKSVILRRDMQSQSAKSLTGRRRAKRSFSNAFDLQQKC